MDLPHHVHMGCDSARLSLAIHTVVSLTIHTVVSLTIHTVTVVKTDRNGITIYGAIGYEVP